MGCGSRGEGGNGQVRADGFFRIALLRVDRKLLGRSPFDEAPCAVGPSVRGIYSFTSCGHIERRPSLGELGKVRAPVRKLPYVTRPDRQNGSHPERSRTAYLGSVLP